jgi:hypothetical protein
MTYLQMVDLQDYLKKLKTMFNLFKKKETQELEEQNKQLKEQLELCSQKLAEKQEHINKTNAFWKKKMKEAKMKKGL